MIARLSGRLDSVAADHAVIDVGGVGYLVFASGRTLSLLGQPGASVAVHVETHVREDHIHLYGFAEPDERDWFRLLTTVQGVGARGALQILTVLPPERLTLAIASQDKGAITKADGIGPKLATRILSELKDKAPVAMAAAPANDPASTTGSGSGGAPGAVDDAVSALMNLGYGRSEAYSVVAGAARQLGDGATVQDLILAGLRELSG